MIALDVSPIIEDVGPYPENKIRCGSFCCNTLVNFLLLNAYTLLMLLRPLRLVSSDGRSI